MYHSGMFNSKESAKQYIQKAVEKDPTHPVVVYKNQRGFRANDILYLTQALQSFTSTNGISINFSGTYLSDNEMELLGAALSHWSCPANLSIDLSDNNLVQERHRAQTSFTFDQKLMHLIRAMYYSGNAHKPLSINLRNNHLYDGDAVLLADALKSEYSRVVSLDLRENHISKYGANALAKALMERTIPKGFILKLDPAVEQEMIKAFKDKIANIGPDASSDNLKQACNARKALEGLYPGESIIMPHLLIDSIDIGLATSLTEINQAILALKKLNLIGVDQTWSKKAAQGLYEQYFRIQLKDPLDAQSLGKLFKEFYERVNELDVSNDNPQWKSLLVQFIQIAGQVDLQNLDTLQKKLFMPSIGTVDEDVAPTSPKNQDKKMDF